MKQAAESNNNGVVGINGKKIPMTASPKDSSPEITNNSLFIYISTPAFYDFVTSLLYHSGFFTLAEKSNFL